MQVNIEGDCINVCDELDLILLYQSDIIILKKEAILKKKNIVRI